MNNGPIINNIKTKEAYRSSLGIEETINTMQGNLCEAINNNTPYAYYFAFIVWCYYDYEINNNKEAYSFSAANNYLKKQNFFFSLSHILNNRNIVGAIGYNYITGNMDLEKDSYVYESEYLQSLQSLEYYMPGLDTLMLVKSETTEGERLSHPTVTIYGKELAKEFENAISNTDYYKYYRLLDKPVPYDSLIELSHTITLDLDTNEELKKCLRNIFFNNKYISFSDGLKSSKDYLLFINSNYGIDVLNNSLRNVLYDYFSPRAYNYSYPNELRSIIKKWELVTSRRYFTLGLSIIWKYMLPLISEPLTFNDWTEKCFNYYDYDFNLEHTVEEIISLIDLDYLEREDIINRCRKDGFGEKKAISDGFKLLLSVYKRLADREDITDEHKYVVRSDSDALRIFGDGGLMDTVSQFLKKPMYEFMQYIMMNYLVLQNKKTADRKLINEGKYGYHFEELSDKYILTRHYSFGLGNDRLIALAGILKQLDMLEGEANE